MRREMQLISRSGSVLKYTRSVPMMKSKHGTVSDANSLSAPSADHSRRSNWDGLIEKLCSALATLILANDISSLSVNITRCAKWAQNIPAIYIYIYIYIYKKNNSHKIK